jgi:hypothetical protein
VSRKATMNKKMIHCFRTFLAKRTIATIWPSSLIEAIRRSNAILVSKPHKKLILGGTQAFHMYLFMAETTDPRNCTS